jgi:hypothetical protein
MRSDSATAVKTAVIRTMRPRAHDAPRRGLAGGGVAPDRLHPTFEDEVRVLAPSGLQGRLSGCSPGGWKYDL